jgi:hypothetical protein
MDDFTLLHIISGNDAIVPEQDVRARLVGPVGLIDAEQYLVFEVKAGDLVHHERAPGAENEFCILSLEPGVASHVFRAAVPPGHEPMQWGAALGKRIKLYRAGKLETAARFHQTGPKGRQ